MCLGLWTLGLTSAQIPLLRFHLRDPGFEIVDAIYQAAPSYFHESRPLFFDANQFFLERPSE
jgi:hypothetical protein